MTTCILYNGAKCKQRQRKAGEGVSLRVGNREVWFCDPCWTDYNDLTDDERERLTRLWGKA